ncbi:MAG: hypothetical protein AAF685_14330 [Cyanobacteria bacterium P01_C01_bin.89]
MTVLVVCFALLSVIYGVAATLDWPSDTWCLGGPLSWNKGDDDSEDDGDFEPATNFNIQPIKLGFYAENDTTPGWRIVWNCLPFHRSYRSTTAMISDHNSVNSITTET